MVGTDSARGQLHLLGRWPSVGFDALLGSAAVWRIGGGVLLALVTTALVAVGPAPAQPPTAQPPIARDSQPPTGTDEVVSAPGTAGLAPDLAAAYTLAEREAHRQGVPLWITSGYRTWAEQQLLWESAIVQYGGPAEAERWVLPPERSTHVAGTAIDVGPYEGAAWLEANGSGWGLCRTYANEWWHFERVTTPGGICPPMIEDAGQR